MTDLIEKAKSIFLAYAGDDRAALEAMVAEDFRFTSPYDNAIDRKTYFTRCWPNHERITKTRFVRTVQDGDEVIVTYESETPEGRVFRNTEVLTFSDGMLIAAEVYFGWNLPHKAEPGGFTDPA